MDTCIKLTESSTVRQELNLQFTVNRMPCSAVNYMANHLFLTSKFLLAKMLPWNLLIANLHCPRQQESSRFGQRVDANTGSGEDVLYKGVMYCIQQDLESQGSVCCWQPLGP